HFPLMAYSNGLNPVILPPGRVRLATNPAPTGSGTWANTIGTVLVASNNAPVLTLPLASMTSGASATSSAAYLRALSAVPCATRWSIRTLSSSRHPNFCYCCEDPPPALPSSGLFFTHFRTHADAPPPLPLRRARRKRPRGRAAEKRYERAPLHSSVSRAPTER